MANTGKYLTLIGLQLDYDLLLIGQCRCRVDYDTSPTRNTRIKLKLVGKDNTANHILMPTGSELLLFVSSSPKQTCDIQ